MDSVPAAGRDGVSVMPSSKDDRETVQLETWASGAHVEVDAPDGAEFLGIDGGFTSDSGKTLRKESWLRVPEGDKLVAKAGDSGAKVWMKTRHLRFVVPPAV